MGRKGLVLSVLVEGEPILCGCSAGLPPQLWRGEPVIVLNPTEQRLEVGKPLQLQCAAMGVPAPSYQWYQNGNPLEHQKKKKLWVMLSWARSEASAAEVGGGRSSLLDGGCGGASEAVERLLKNSVLVTLEMAGRSPAAGLVAACRGWGTLGSVCSAGARLSLPILPISPTRGGASCSALSLLPRRAGQKLSPAAAVAEGRALGVEGTRFTGSF